MRSIFFLAVMLTLAAAPVLAQIDSLQITQVGVISVSEGVQKCLAANFWNDNSIELVASGSHHVWVYDGASRTLLWTSPYLVSYLESNWQVELYDVNLDGRQDLAIQDSAHLYIYDIVNAQMLWTSPSLLDHKTSFGLGDRNSDGYIDIILARRGPTDMDDNPDVSTFEVYDGPDFQLAGQYTFYSEAYHHGYPDYMNLLENPGPMVIADLSGTQGFQRKIVMFAERYAWAHYWDGAYVHLYQGHGGSVKIYDPISFAVINTNAGGIPLFCSVRGEDSLSTYLYAVTTGHSSYSNDQGYHSNSFGDDFYAISAAGVPSTWQIGRYSSTEPATLFTHPMIGDIDSDHPGDEICYGYRDTLKLLSFPDRVPVWSCRNDSIAKYSLFLYHCPRLFNTPRILGSIGLPGFPGSSLVMYNGDNGNLTGIFPNQGLVPGMVVDLDSDGEDEILWYYWNDEHLYVYHVFNPANDLDEPEILPASFCLYANYPNPFNATTIIKYDLPEAAYVTIDIYDLLGRKISTLVDEQEVAGTHQLVWDGSSISSGVYFYRLKAGEYTDIKKMTLLK